MFEDKSNIALIGLPGSCKNTVGAVLAKLTARSFLETDVFIEKAHNRPLQDIVKREGYIDLRIKRRGDPTQTRLVQSSYRDWWQYSMQRTAMAHLKSCGIIVFLNLELAMLSKSAWL